MLTVRYRYMCDHRPSLYWLSLKLIKGKIHYFVKKGKTLVKICPLPSVTKVVMVQKSGMEQKDLRPSQWGRNFTESCFREGTGNAVWKYMRSV